MPSNFAKSAKTVCLTLLVAAFLLPQVEAGLAMRFFAGISTGYLAQGQAANSYRTDLWGMEFQDREEQRKDLKSSPNDEDQLSSEAGAVRARPKSEVDDWGSVPGQVYLADITQDTPFAEWQVNRSAAEEGAHFSGGPTAWVMSGVRARTSRFDAETPHTNGPSVLTLLVAMIACLVMAGALLSDR